VSHAARKVCDTVATKCQHSCSLEGNECIYREKGQPGLRPGFGKALESRLDLLENTMDDVKGSLDRVLAHIQQQPAPPTTHHPAHPSSSQPTLADAGAAWHTPQIGSSVQAQVGPTSYVAGSVSFDTPSQSALVDSDLPSAQVLTSLVDIYFDMIYAWCPLFHRSTFTNSIFEMDHRALLHGVVVVTLRFLDILELPEVEKERHLTVSREYVLHSAMDNCTLMSTQALALLAVDAIGSGTGPRTWNIMSLLATAARQLGLFKDVAPAAVEPDTPLVHNDDDYGEIDPTFVVAEERRRLIWVLCLLDRLSSVQHGQLGNIKTRAIRAGYPSMDDEWGVAVVQREYLPPPSTDFAFVRTSPNLWHHFIDLLDFVDRSNQLLLQPVNLTVAAHCQEWQSNFRRLDVNLSTWYEGLPMAIRLSQAEFSVMWTLLQATYYLWVRPHNPVPSVNANYPPAYASACTLSPPSPPRPPNMSSPPPPPASAAVKPSKP
jgi:hypothetical protein